MVAVLSLSGPHLENCESVIVAMRELGIHGDVTANKSVDPNGNIEPGCRVLVANDIGQSAHRLWNEMKKKDSSLECAHIFGYDVTYGCIFDVFRPSLCPSKQ